MTSTARATLSWGQSSTTLHACPQGLRGESQASSQRCPQRADASIVIVCAPRGLCRGVPCGSWGTWRGVTPTLGDSKGRCLWGGGVCFVPLLPDPGWGLAAAPVDLLPAPPPPLQQSPPLPAPEVGLQGGCGPSYLWVGHSSSSPVPPPRRCPRCREQGTLLSQPRHRRSHPGVRAWAGQGCLGQPRGWTGVSWRSWQEPGCATHPPHSGHATGGVLVALGL